MANFKEIVTKAVLGKGKRVFSSNNTAKPQIEPSTILGCWVINHEFFGTKIADKIKIEGSYDVNIWYSCENDTKTEVIKTHNTYSENVSINKRSESQISKEEVLVSSLTQPTCVKAEVVDGEINYTIDVELGIEIVGDTKVKIAIDENEEAWDEIIIDESSKIENEIDEEVKEDYL